MKFLLWFFGFHMSSSQQCIEINLCFIHKYSTIMCFVLRITLLDIDASYYPESSEEKIQFPKWFNVSNRLRKVG